MGEPLFFSPARDARPKRGSKAGAGPGIWGQKGKSHIQRASSQGRERRRRFCFPSLHHLRMYLSGHDEALLLSIHSRLQVDLSQRFPGEYL